MVKVSVKGYRLPGLVTDPSTLGIWLQISSALNKNQLFPKPPMVGLISHVSSDTAILGELNETYTGRGSLFPTIKGDREDPDFRFNWEARIK